MAPTRQVGHAVTALLGAADAVRRRFERTLAPEDVTWQQYNVLRILRGAEPEGLATLAIRDRLIEAAPGITRLLDRLEEKAWVRRLAAGHDRRQRRCRITPEGLRLLDRLDARMNRADKEAFAGLRAAEVDQLTAWLALVRKAAES